MSSKSSSSSRTSSPRAMPMETIITRFKSAQQKRQLREMDRSMTKVTELLKNPLKLKVKKKMPIKKSQSSSSSVIKDDDRSKRSKGKVAEDSTQSYSMKRHVLNKIRLKPKHDMKIIAQTNKRKRSVPKKGSASQIHPEAVDSDNQSKDGSPVAKKPKPLSQDMSMNEMIQLIEDSGSLNDEDLLEILTCPSPVWWEDPPDGYIEDALFSRPRSTGEMYPSIRSQLQENLQDRQRSSTPNVLSRPQRVFQSVSNKNEVTNKQTEESIKNDDIDLRIALNKRDEKFIKKRCKLESVLGNLKSKNVKNNNSDNRVIEPISDASVDSVSNKVSVIKNLTDQVKDGKCSEVSNENKSPLKVSVPMETDSECTDDERLTDVSFQEDTHLNDLENMDIPVQKDFKTPDIQVRKDTQPVTHVQKDSIAEIPAQKDLKTPPKKDEEKKVEASKLPDVKKNKVAPSFVYESKTDTCTISECSLNKCKGFNYKQATIDPTYSDKRSSIIEDYFEMKLFEDEEPIKNNFNSQFAQPQAKFAKDSKKPDTNLTTSVIKFKNSDNTSINVLKFESVVPKNLPPLMNIDLRKGNVGCVPKNLPPLIRNPVIHLIPEPTPKEGTTLFDMSNYAVLKPDNIDSISDTNVCFLNDDDCTDGKVDNTTHGPILSTVIKSSNIIQTNQHFYHTTNKDYLKKSKCDVFPSNKIHFTQNVNLFKNLTHINGVIANQYNDLEFQSLTITKVNDNSCCKGDESKMAKKTDGNLVNTKPKRKEENNNAKKKINSPIQEIKKVEKSPECVTVYKIVSDDEDGNASNKKAPKTKTKNVQKPLDAKETKIDQKPDDLTEKSDVNKDKMIFYFKKCKNLYWKHKVDDKKLDGVKETVAIDNTNIGVDGLDKGTQPNKVLNKVNNNLKKEQKCIIVSNAKQIRYCMKCSSIFDTAQCNYCYRKNGESKNQFTTDYLLKMEQCFICDVCRYKALSKDSLERHILSHSDRHR